MAMNKNVFFTRVDERFDVKKIEEVEAFIDSQLEQYVLSTPQKEDVGNEQRRISIILSARLTTKEKEELIKRYRNADWSEVFITYFPDERPYSKFEFYE